LHSSTASAELNELALLKFLGLKYFLLVLLEIFVLKLNEDVYFFLFLFFIANE
jgi:hypothetical protein